MDGILHFLSSSVATASATTPLTGALLVGSGMFSMLGAVCNWEWFFNDCRARLFVRCFGREGARIFYFLLGLGLLIGAICYGFWSIR